MRSLEDCRRQIDEIDASLVRLFEERINVVTQVAEYKRANGLKVRHPDRERAVVERAASLLQNPGLRPQIEALFETLMRGSREYQRQFLFAGEGGEDALFPVSAPDADARLGFQGVAGSFSEEAMLAFFGDGHPYRSFERFADVFRALEDEEIDYGVLPVENSSTGTVTEICDLMLRHAFWIVGAQNLRVRQHLMGLPGTGLGQIREVYSHPQGLAQSAAFLDGHPDWRRIPYLNTAAAAKLVGEAKDPSRAAIGGARAAALYGLDIVASDVNDRGDNNTLFMIIGRRREALGEPNRVSVAFRLPHRPGSLAGMLALFAEEGLNLAKIESRPVEGRPWEYVFFVDLEGNLRTPRMAGALRKAEERSEQFRLLGCYPRRGQ
jgi:chorismate mutase/prephenate dehydratase